METGFESKSTEHLLVVRENLLRGLTYPLGFVALGMLRTLEEELTSRGIESELDKLLPRHERVSNPYRVVVE